jgi:actin-related protein 6
MAFPLSYLIRVLIDRRMAELRSLAPVDCDVMVYECDEYVSDIIYFRRFQHRSIRPITEAYLSALSFANTADFLNVAVSRAEYQESGSNACRKKFKDWKDDEKSKEKGTTSLAKGKGKQKDTEEGAKKGGRMRNRVSSTTIRRR